MRDMSDYTWLYELPRVKHRAMLYRIEVLQGRCMRAVCGTLDGERATADMARAYDAVMRHVVECGYTLSDIDAAKKRRKKKIE